MTCLDVRAIRKNADGELVSPVYTGVKTTGLRRLHGAMRDGGGDHGAFSAKRGVGRQAVPGVRVANRR
uniref:Uncharacterized protein n=1 Tax=uncultured marine virus TaxID=186617 RepID=A0A0F7L3U8_9VIRU|nr:hypothetical protein [uncultured marine virus]